VGLGEIPCDILPEGRQLGGPRANFAYFSGLLGDRGIITSRVGTDISGRSSKGPDRGAGIAAASLQSNTAHLTGTAKV
jgi:sugar/nucleoside kinase (ribokinase family)